MSFSCLKKKTKTKKTVFKFVKNSVEISMQQSNQCLFLFASSLELPNCREQCGQQHTMSLDQWRRHRKSSAYETDRKTDEVNTKLHSTVSLQGSANRDWTTQRFLSERSLRALSEHPLRALSEHPLRALSEHPLRAQWTPLEGPQWTPLEGPQWTPLEGSVNTPWGLSEHRLQH